MDNTALAHPITRYSDDSCRLGSGEMRKLAARDDAGQLLMVNCSPPDFSSGPAPELHQGERR